MGPKRCWTNSSRTANSLPHQHGDKFPPSHPQLPQTLSPLHGGQHRMNHSTRRLSILLITFCAVLFIAALCAVFWAKSTAKPQLTLSFLGYTKERVATFAVTNEGTATAVHYPHGRLESTDQSASRNIGCRASVHRLAAGKADVIMVSLPQSFDGRWRFTCFYARDGFKSRLYDWTWSPKGPRERANRFIPQFLKGVVMDVTATSDWIDN